jgi:nitrogen-specific signal transduction histidine kinase/CheY-like chemotaxis protein
MWTQGEKPDFVVVVVQDVSERKRMEAQFFRAQRLESIGTLASGIAHDLNNILSPILMAPPIIRASATPEGVEKMLAMVETSALRGAKLVRQLLTFGRGSEGGKKLLTVVTAVRDVMAIVQQTFPKNITPSAEVPGDSWPILADATQVHQVLLNLCVNARDAMPQGGVLRIAATNEHFDPKAAAGLPGAKVGDYVMLSVMDTGTGMSPELIDRIFDPFFTTKEEGKGTGLGLATVLGLVKGHGGFVALESAPGRGSTFRVYFPAVPKSEGVLPTVCAVALPPGQGEMLLVVDNEENIRDAISQTLVQHGYLAVVAEDGIEGIAHYSAAEKEIKLVITDLDMPHMDGITMIKVMRKINPSLKVIVSSGASGRREMASRLHELKELGVTTVLSKPFTSEQVLSAVHEALRVERRRPVEGVRRAWR